MAARGLVVHSLAGQVITSSPGSGHCLYAARDEYGDSRREKASTSGRVVIR